MDLTPWMGFRIFFLVLTTTFGTQMVFAQAGPSDWFDCDTTGITVSNCDTEVPSMFVDLRNSPSQKWYSCKIRRGPRDSLCCGAAVTGNDQCIEFKVMLHPNVDAVILEIPSASETEWQNDQSSYSGPNPVPPSPGARPSINTYRIKTPSGVCMGPFGGANGDEPACLTSSILNDTVFIMFCQTGNNENVYRLKTLRAEINPDVSVLAEGCGSTLTVSAEDIDVSSVTWNSTQNPAFNAYLSSTMGDTTVTVTVPKGALLPPGMPPVLEYQVCADPIASGIGSCGSLPQVCALVQVTVVSPPSATVNAPTVCPGDPYFAEVTGQGPTVLDYTWFDAPDGGGTGVNTGSTDQYTYPSPGDKSVVIFDPIIVALGFNECAFDTINFTINTHPLPDAQISGPPLICINTNYGFSTPNVPGASYAWQFREYPSNTLITTSSSRTPTVQFSNCGDKLALLTVTSNQGCDSMVMRVFQADSIPPDLSGCTLPNPSVECGGTVQNNANITAWHNANLAILINASGCVTDDCPWTVTSDFDLGNFTPDLSCGGGTTAGQIPVIYTVSDGCQSSTISAVYTITDSAPPTVNDPMLADMSFECVGLIPPPDTNFMASDVCGSVSRVWLGDSPIGSPCNLTITRTYRVTDACMNMTDFVQTFTINDISDPVITCPSAVVIEACGVDTLATHSSVANLEYSTVNRNITLAELQAAGGNANDNCGIEQLYYFDSQTGSCPIIVTRTFVVVDSCGNGAQCTQQIDIDDTTDPQITCPAQVTIEGCDVGDLAGSPLVGNLGFSSTNQTITLLELNNLLGVATDNCSISTIYYSDTRSSSCPIIVTRTFTVVDGCGNMNQCTQQILIDDTTPPTITCPSNITLEECIVSDLSNSALVGNLEYSEINRPIVLADLTALGGTASDICGIESMFYFDSQSGSCPIVINRTFVAVDTCGNSDSCVQVIQIDDTTFPLLSCPAPLNLEACGVRDLENIAAAGMLEYSESIRSITAAELVGAGGSASDNCGIDSLYYIDSQSGTCPITVIRTFVAVDTCNNRVQCTQQITIDDTTFPLLSCPIDITLEACSTADLASIPQVGSLEYSETIRNITVAELALTGGSASDNCGIDSLYYIDSQSGSCPIVLTRTFTVVDSCGNRLSCTQMISIDDTTDPTLLCPNDDVIEACGIGDLATSAQVGNLEYSEIPRPITVLEIQNLGGDASDNCSIDSLYYIDSRTGRCPIVVTRTYVVVDSCGNRTNCAQSITINDTTDPLLTCPPPAVVEACDVDDLMNAVEVNNFEYSETPRPITVLDIQGLGGDASDNCSIDSLYYIDAQTGSCPIVVTRTFVVVDTCGNRVECDQDVQIFDTTDPLITCPVDEDIEACNVGDLGSSAQVGSLEYSEVPRFINLTDLQSLGGNASDNCGIDSLYYIDSRTGFCPIEITRTFVVVDSCGNRVDCQQLIRIFDTTLPTLTCPGPQVLEDCGVGDLQNSAQVGNLEYSESIRILTLAELQAISGDADDNCGIDSLYYFDSQVGFCPIIITRTYVVVDSCGNRLDCQQEIQINDTTDPILTCPVDDVIEACTLADLALSPQVGNLEYSEPIRNITIVEFQSTGGNVSDNCGLDSLYYYDSQTGFCPIIITRTFVAVDSCGNRVDCQQEIQINDTTDPSLTCPAPVVIEGCDEGILSSAPEVGSLEYSEMIRAITVAEIQSVGGDASDNCGIDSLYYFDSQTGFCPIVITRTFVVVDSCGNRVECDQEVQINDTTLPQISCPAPVVIEACTVSDLSTAPEVGSLEYSEIPRNITLAELNGVGGSASDECGIDSLFYTDSRSGACPIVITRTFVVVDSCGNRLTCDQEIQIDDTTLPLISCPVDVVVEACSVADLGTTIEVGNLEYSEVPRIIALADLVGLGASASDNCGIDSLYYIDASSGFCPITVVRTFVVIDSCGNRLDCSYNIEIEDTTLPSITCPATEIIEACGVRDLENSAQVGNLEYSEVIRFIDVTDLQALGGDASDNCGIDSLYYIDAQTGFCPIIVTRTFVVVDSCGNRLDCQQEIQINDTTDPVLSCPADDAVEGCSTDELANSAQVGNLEYSEAIRFVNVSDLQALGGDASDNCGIDSLYYFDVKVGSCPIVVTRTFIAVDSCGNRVECTQEIEIGDTTDPTLTCPADQSIEGCDESILASTASVGNLEYSEVIRPIAVSDLQGIGGDAGDNCFIDSLYYFDSQTGSCPIVITRTFVVVDSCGNRVECPQEIEIDDTTLPTLTCPPSASIEACRLSDLSTRPEVGNLEFSALPRSILVADIQGLGGNASDLCGIDSLYYVDVQTGICPITLERTFVVVDSCGNRVDCIQDIEIHDTTDPLLTCPGNVTVEACGVADLASAVEVANWGYSETVVSIDLATFQSLGGDASDNCGIDSLYYFDSQSGFCPITVSRTFVVIDSCGNTLQCVQEIEINDQTLPTISCPGPQTIEACTVDDLASATEVGNLEYSEAIRFLGLTDFQSISGDAADNCGIDSLYYFDTQTGFCPIVVTRTFVVVDSCGNRLDCQQEIQINDTTLPSLTCPEEITGEGCELDDVLALSGLAYSSATVIIDEATFNALDAQSAVSDLCGIQEISYVDVIDQASCPLIITRTFDVIDLCGNISTCTQLITVEDTQEPEITCPAEVIGEGCNISALETLTGLAYSSTAIDIGSSTFNSLDGSSNVSDNCGIEEITYIDAIDQMACPIIITRTFSVTDSCGLLSVCTQQITIEDTEESTIVCPQDISIEGCSTEELLSLTGLEFSGIEQSIDGATFDALDPVSAATDNCGVREVRYSDVIVVPSCPIRIERTFTVYDSCGLIASCTQLLELTPITLSDPNCPPSITIDPCLTQPEVDALFEAWKAEFQYLGDGCNLQFTPIDTIAAPSSCGGEKRIDFVVADGCANFKSCNATFTVPTAPILSITCPSSINVQCESQVPAPYGSVAEFESDGGSFNNTCGIVEASFRLIDEVSDDNVCPEIRIRTYEVRDVCGHIQTCTQQIRINDTIPPVLTGVPTDLTVACTAVPPPPVIGVDIVATDNCSSPPIIFEEIIEPGICENIYSIIRTWTATDECNNMIQTVQNITVTDCRPDVEISLNPNPVCLNGDVILNATISDNYNRPVYRWQFLWNGTWIDVNNGNTVPFTLADVTLEDQGLYRLLIADNLQNLFDDDCNVVSDEVELLVVEPVITDLVESICEGETFSVGSSAYDVTGTYTDILVAQSGCDSVVNLDLTVLEDTEHTIDTFICQGEIFTIGNSSWTQSGTYQKLLTNSAGCDSTITVNLIVHDPTFISISDTICEGEVLQIGSESYDSTGLYTQVYTDQFGCDSIYNINLTVVPKQVTVIDAQICFGQRYRIAGQSFSAPGTYEFDLTSTVTGCDSLVILNLVVTNEIRVTLDKSICIGDSILVGTIYYDSSGTYIDTLTANAGCDSIVTLNLELVSTITTLIDTTLCEGESIVVGSQVYDVTGNYVDTLASSGGCDSVVTVNLIVYPVSDTTIIAQICQGSTFQAGGQIFNSSGFYTLNLPTSHGCDSTINIDLTVHSNYDSLYVIELCAGETITLGAETYAQTGQYTQSFTSSTGCDSIVRLDLTVHPAYDIKLNQIICSGNTVQIGQSTYDASGVYVDSLTTTAGCDSIITLDLTVVDVITTEITEQICDGNNYTFAGNVYTQSGTYVETFTSTQGCDSVVTLELQVLTVLRDTIEATICEGESFDFDGTPFTTTGSFNKSYMSDAGCDSIVTLQLIVVPIERINLFEEICEGESFELGVNTYSTSGIFVDTLVAITGCDSIVSLNLFVQPAVTVSLSRDICAGETFQFGNLTLDSTGTYIDSLFTSNGCDSIVTLSLVVHEVYNVEFNVQICQGQSYSFDGQLLTTSGSYTANLSTDEGCDSMVTMQLEVVDVLQTDIFDTICAGDVYTFFNQSLTTSGTYSENLLSVAGCDSIVTLYLQVLNSKRTATEASICEGDSFLFNTVPLVSPGIYVDTFSTTAGCDSIVTLDLTVYPNYQEEVKVSICSGEFFSFHSRSLDSSGIYADTLVSMHGCDSIVILDLTVHPILGDTVDVQICAGQSYTLAGSAYSETGIYEETITSSLGCDSTIVLQLSVVDQLRDTLEVFICAGETYDFNGEIKNSSGVYETTLASSLGCDSIVTLILSVTDVILVESTISVCEGELMVFGGDTITSSGIYRDTLLSRGGCDSVSVVDLTIFPELYDTTRVQICFGETFDFQGATYDSAGVYTDTALTADGCNHYQILVLSVSELVSDTISISICAGEAYSFDGQQLTESGTYETINVASSGCDSLTALNLNVREEIEINSEIQICLGQSYSFNGSTLTEPGMYQEVFTSSLGCDSTVNLTLSTVQTIRTDEQAFICAGDSVVIGGRTYYTEGQYQDTLVSSGGCDSIVTISISTAEPKTTDIEVMICEGESFFFNGQELTSSTIKTDTLVSAEGCDSIVELNLQVVQSYEEDIQIALCNGSTYEYNGISYGESGLFDVLLMSSQGCDSIIHLQINVVTEIIDSQEVQICTGGSYQFAGATISESGIYRDTVLSSAGCDSIIILDLQVVTTIESSESFTICEGDSVLIGGIYYSDQVILQDTFLSTQGCDSVITYQVIVQPGVLLAGSDFTICEGESVALDLQVTGSLIGPLSWSPIEGLSCSDCPNPTANPTRTTTYEVSTPACLGDTAKAEFTVVVEPNPELATIEDQRIILGESVTLSATAEGAFTIDWYLGEDLLCTNCESILQQPKENTTYTVTAYSEFGCAAEAEVLVEISGDPCDIGAIKAPNAITPNGDGFNDEFIVNNDGEAQINLIQIFNRWGETVFESSGADRGWDGTFHGVAVNPGVYMYIIHAECAEIGNAILAGNITVIR